MLFLDLLIYIQYLQAFTPPIQTRKWQHHHRVSKMIKRTMRNVDAERCMPDIIALLERLILKILVL